MKLIVEILGLTHKIELPSEGDRGTAVIDGKEILFDFRAGSDGAPGSLIIDGNCYSVESVPHDERWLIRADEHDFEAAVTDERRERLAGLTQASKGGGRHAGEVRAPMPGLIIKLEVEKGNRVEKGAGLLIVEAMKMENEIKSAVNGVVVGIGVGPGQTVEKGQILMTIQED